MVERSSTQRSRNARPKASERVRDEWQRRVEAEYRSAAITQHLTLWLIQIGASPDLLDDGLRIVRDELKHAELSHRVYTAAGGTQASQIARDTLSARRTTNGSLEHDVLRLGVEGFCLGETAAVRLFKELRSECVVAPARRALDRILRDEVRHRDFGWCLLEWLLESPLGPELRSLAEYELPAMLARIRSLYAPVRSLPEEAMSPSERAWGLMPPSSYARVLAEVLERDYVPRFARLRIDAGHAWHASTALTAG